MLGEQIRSARQRRKWSQDEVVRRANVSKRALSKLERGEAVNPTLETLQRLADVLEIELVILPTQHKTTTATPLNEEWSTLLTQAQEVLGQMDTVFGQYRVRAYQKLIEKSGQ